jgi:hypothetical protein
MARRLEPSACIDCARHRIRSARVQNADFRLRHRRRGVGGLRAGRQADRERSPLGTSPGGRRHRSPFLRADAAGLRQDLLRSRRKLELPRRARPGPCGQCGSLAARQASRWFEFDQRDGLDPGPPPRLRRLARGRQSRLGLGRTPARIPCGRGQRGRRGRMARARRTGPRQRHARPCTPPHPALSRRGPAGRAPAQSRFQRRKTGRGRHLPDHDEERPTHVGGAGLSSPGDATRQSRRGDPRDRDAHPFRGKPRSRARLSHERREADRARQPRGDRERRSGRLAATPRTLRHWRPEAARGARDRSRPCQPERRRASPGSSGHQLHLEIEPADAEPAAQALVGQGTGRSAVSGAPLRTAVDEHEPGPATGPTCSSTSRHSRR